MQDVTVTFRDGRTAQLQNIYIRGSQVRFMILPDMLKNAPMLRQVKGGTAGRGKAAILKAQVDVSLSCLQTLWQNSFSFAADVVRDCNLPSSAVVNY